MVVPSGQPKGCISVISPASSMTSVPLSAPFCRVVRRIFDTAEMAASASPRKPIVRMASRSRSSRSLDVAWRRKATPASSGDMPQPSSRTRIIAAPPPRISTVMFFAPASIAFSTSSLTTEAGRSTTSPAAIRSATWGERMLITLIVLSPVASIALFHDDIPAKQRGLFRRTPIINEIS